MLRSRRSKGASWALIIYENTPRTSLGALLKTTIELGRANSALGGCFHQSGFYHTRAYAGRGLIRWRFSGRKQFPVLGPQNPQAHCIHLPTGHEPAHLIETMVLILTVCHSSQLAAPICLHDIVINPLPHPPHPPPPSWPPLSGTVSSSMPLAPRLRLYMP